MSAFPRARRLHVGCGRNVFPGWVNVDVEAIPGAVRSDIHHLPFRDGAFEYVLAAHVLEHIPDVKRAIQELARVLRPAGTLEIRAPDYCHENAFADLGHVHFFTPRSMDCFTEGSELFRHRYPALFSRVRVEVIRVHGPYPLIPRLGRWFPRLDQLFRDRIRPAHRAPVPLREAMTGKPRVGGHGEVVRVARDALLLSGASIGAAILSFLVWVYLARALVPEDYGALGAAVAFVALFQMFGDLGINYYAIREGAKEPTRATDVVRTLLGLKLALLAGVTVLVAVLALGLPFRSTERGLILLYLATLPVSGIATYLMCLLNAHRRMARVAAVQLGERVAYAALAPPIVGVGLGAVGAALAAVVSSALYAGFALAATRGVRTGPLWPPAPARTWRPHLVAASQFGVAALLMGVMQRLDVVLLAVLSDPTHLARYVAASQVFVLLLLVATGLAQAAFPWIVGRIHRGEMPLRDLWKWTVILGGLSTALAIVAVASAPWAFPFLLGPGFTGGAPVFQVLVWAFVPAFATIPFALALDALNLQKVHVANASAMVTINVALNAVLIPSTGALGAAWAAVASWGYGLFAGVSIAHLMIRRTQRREDPRLR